MKYKINKARLNSEKEYKKYYENNHLGGNRVCWGFDKKPKQYPCILVWYHYDDGEDEIIFGEYIYKEDLE